MARPFILSMCSLDQRIARLLPLAPVSNTVASPLGAWRGSACSSPEKGPAVKTYGRSKFRRDWIFLSGSDGLESWSRLKTLWCTVSYETLRVLRIRDSRPIPSKNPTSDTSYSTGQCLRVYNSRKIARNLDKLQSGGTANNSRHINASLWVKVRNEISSFHIMCIV